jgi:methionyl aminopeptidase
MAIFIKNKEQIELMRKAGRICAGVHEALAGHIRPGITTGELSQIAHDYILSKDASPSFLGYRGYPAPICASVNEEVIHGIPGGRKLEAGDIISIDIGVMYKRFHGDAARTHAVGEISRNHRLLIESCEKSFFEGMKFASAKNYLNEISAAIEDCADGYGFKMVYQWCGHGIGRQVHEDPQVYNVRQERKGPKLSRGMTLAVEPMINISTGETFVLEDTWTIVTGDGLYSSHYENTVLITDGEPDILTML